MSGCEVAILVHPALSGAPTTVERQSIPPFDLLDAAAQGGVRRVVQVTPREGTASNSKREPADQPPAAAFPREWIALRTAPVYGVGDD